MRLKSDYKHPQNWEFEIEHELGLGFYLWVYKDEETMDYLQDTLERVKAQAFKYFGVPLDSWVEASERQGPL